MQENMIMYMVTHKDVNVIPKGRRPIFVGDGSNSKLFQRDNTGDNIALKNKNYCELTAMYWIWKNEKKAKYVSLEHYRRFFLKPGTLKIINNQELLDILTENDVVTSRLFYFQNSVYDYYCRNHIKSDLDAVKQVIDKKYPEYSKAYTTIMAGNRTAMLNMCAMSKEKFDLYCSWLFDILFTVEEKINLSNRNAYQQRVLGFLSERLLDVWLLHNEINAMRLPIYYLDSNKIISILKTIKYSKLK